MSQVPYNADKASTSSPDYEKDNALVSETVIHHIIQSHNYLKDIPVDAEQKVVANAEFLAVTQTKLDWRTRESMTILIGCFVSFMCAVST
jgi:hypothetical protein